MPFHKLQALALRLALVRKDALRKPRFQIAREALAWWIHKREVPTAYFYYLHYNRGHEEPLSYMSHGEWKTIVTATRQPNRSIFRDKLLFQSTFENTAVRLPEYLGHLGFGFFYDANHEFTPVTNQKDVANLVTGNLLTSGRDCLFAKPIIGYGGHGAVLVSSEEDVSELYSSMHQVSYLLQERVRQHPALDEIYPGCANTLRLVTFVEPGGEVMVLSARARFGHGGMHVDNGTSGGFFVGVDLGSGRIKTPGLRTLNSGGGRYWDHPDTGTPLFGRKIPLFDAALEMVRVGARLTQYPLVGWDVAIAEDGPVVLEGNTSLDLLSEEMTEGPWQLHPVLGPFIRSVLKAG